MSTTEQEGRPTDEQLVADTRAALDAMQSQIDDLAARLMAATEEVRTRRLVVVDEEGYERVIIDTLDMSAGIHVRCKVPDRPEGCEPYVSILATEERDEPAVGVYLWSREEMAVELELVDTPNGAATPDLRLTDFHTEGDDWTVKGFTAGLCAGEVQVGRVRLADPDWGG